MQHHWTSFDNSLKRNIDLFDNTPWWLGLLLPTFYAVAYDGLTLCRWLRPWIEKIDQHLDHLFYGHRTADHKPTRLPVFLQQRLLQDGRSGTHLSDQCQLRTAKKRVSTKCSSLNLCILRKLKNFQKPGTASLGGMYHRWLMPSCCRCSMDKSATDSSFSCISWKSSVMTGFLYLLVKSS